MEGKIAVIGDADFVLPFKALGVEIFTVEKNREEILEAAQEILKQKFALVVAAENVAQAASEVFEPTQRQSMPCVVAIPTSEQSEGYATKSLGKLLKHATGINILAN